MDTRIFHGNITPDNYAQALIAKYNRGNLRAQKIGSGDKVVVQIATTNQPHSGGHTALTVMLEKVPDGVAVKLGEQSWLGIAASLGQTALFTWRNPWSLIHRVDDLAQDIEHLQLSEEVWDLIEEVSEFADASFQLTDRLRRITCNYCMSANPVGESNCVACGAPLGLVHPNTCQKCGFVITPDDDNCPNCGENMDFE